MPDQVDYEAIIDQFNLIEKINRKEMDEVWLFGFPYAGFYESRMVGPGSFFCNAPPLDIYHHCLRRFVIMGFNYERGVGEMLESMGHRAEFTMSQVYGHEANDDNLWRKFCRIERTHPDRSQVGTCTLPQTAAVIMIGAISSRLSHSAEHGRISPIWMGRKADDGLQ